MTSCSLRTCWTKPLVSGSLQASPRLSCSRQQGQRERHSRMLSSERRSPKNLEERRNSAYDVPLNCKASPTNCRRPWWRNLFIGTRRLRISRRRKPEVPSTAVRKNHSRKRKTRQSTPYSTVGLTKDRTRKESSTPGWQPSRTCDVERSTKRKSYRGTDGSRINIAHAIIDCKKVLSLLVKAFMTTLFGAIWKESHLNLVSLMFPLNALLCWVTRRYILWFLG